MATNTGEYMIPKRALGPDDTGPVMVQVFALSDVGMTREHNEDAFIVANLSGGEPLQFDRLIEQKADAMGTLFMVADGMGGAAAGEIASATAIDVVLRHLREDLASRQGISPEDFVAALSKAAEVANWSIFRYAAGNAELRGMGTTATIAALLGDTLYLAQVGDSRAYLIRDGEAVQLTKDQSLMQKLIEAGELTEEEAAHSDRRNIILQALGPEPTVRLDLTHQQVRRGDVLVLCSDGLSGLVKADQIARAVRDEMDLVAVCDRLIATANDLGGPDNITVVAARFDGSGLVKAESSDKVGHNVFPLGTQETSGESPAPTAVTIQVVEPVSPPIPAAPPVVETPDVSEARRKRGEFYVRLIALIGFLLVLALAGRLLGKW
jgi:protein phosphatase